MMLHEFLESNREELIRSCKLKVANRHAPRATERELEYGIPIFLTQLTEILREESRDSNGGSLFRPPTTAASPTSIEIANTADRHGNELCLKGFTVDQVVHAYGDRC